MFDVPFSTHLPCKIEGFGYPLHGRRFRYNGNEFFTLNNGESSDPKRIGSTSRYSGDSGTYVPYRYCIFDYYDGYPNKYRQVVDPLVQSFYFKDPTATAPERTPQQEEKDAACGHEWWDGLIYNSSDGIVHGVNAYCRIIYHDRVSRENFFISFNASGLVLKEVIRYNDRYRDNRDDILSSEITTFYTPWPENFLNAQVDPNTGQLMQFSVTLFDVIEDGSKFLLGVYVEEEYEKDPFSSNFTNNPTLQSTSTIPKEVLSTFPTSIFEFEIIGSPRESISVIATPVLESWRQNAPTHLIPQDIYNQEGSIVSDENISGVDDGHLATPSSYTWSASQTRQYANNDPTSASIGPVGPEESGFLQWPLGEAAGERFYTESGNASLSVGGDSASDSQSRNVHFSNAGNGMVVSCYYSAGTIVKVTLESEIISSYTFSQSGNLSSGQNNISYTLEHVPSGGDSGSRQDTLSGRMITKTATKHSNTTYTTMLKVGGATVSMVELVASGTITHNGSKSAWKWWETESPDFYTQPPDTGETSGNTHTKITIDGVTIVDTGDSFTQHHDSISEYLLVDPGSPWDYHSAIGTPNMYEAMSWVRHPKVYQLGVRYPGGVPSLETTTKEAMDLDHPRFDLTFIKGEWDAGEGWYSLPYGLTYSLGNLVFKSSIIAPAVPNIIKQKSLTSDIYNQWKPDHIVYSYNPKTDTIHYEDSFRPTGNYKSGTYWV